MNNLMSLVYEENSFTGEYDCNNYINELPGAVEEAISKQHRLINFKEDPHIVLQKLAVCLEYCKCDPGGIGKVYDADFTVIGDIDDDAFEILMREKNKLKVSVLKNIIQYFRPDYWLEDAQRYGYGDGIELKSYEIMEKLIRGENVDSDIESKEYDYIKKRKR